MPKIRKSTLFLAASLSCLLAAATAKGDVIEFVITIDGGQEVPPIDSPATGSGTATLDTTTNEFSWFIEFEVDQLKGPETAAHFHGDAPYCANAGVQIGLPLGSPKVGSQTLTPAQADAVKQGLWYVNIHTTVHPPGEIRGQVLPGPIGNPFPPVEEGAIHVQLVTVSENLTSPNWGTHAPGHPDRLFVTDQPGQLWVIDLETNQRTMFLDATDFTVDMGAFGPNTFDERGLLGIAFHPDYLRNGLVYTYTSEPEDGDADYSTMPPDVDPNHQTVIREWQVPNPADPESVVDPDSSRVLLRIDQPQFNHNGGGLEFGPDGMLYISIGDGGGANDQGVGHPCIGNGQDTTNPLGTLLRLDPLGDNSPNGQYGIPNDNPFVGVGGFLDEIWAYGLRNPWRFAFDQAGDQLLWLADVGQNDIEEINVIDAGGNYGWPYLEGSFYFIKNGHQSGYITDMFVAPPSGVSGPFLDPIAEYHNPTEGVAVIGGFVYRGDRIPTLHGKYVFGDWSLSFSQPQGRIFYLDDNNKVVEFAMVDAGDHIGLFVNGFGQDASGEIYVLGNLTGTPFQETGVVLRIAPKLGDFNGDGVTDGADLGQLLANWGPCEDCDFCPWDLTGDCNVDGADLGQLLANWG